MLSDFKNETLLLTQHWNTCSKNNIDKEDMRTVDSLVSCTSSLRHMNHNWLAKKLPFIFYTFHYSSEPAAGKTWQSLHDETTSRIRWESLPFSSMFFLGF